MSNRTKEPSTTPAFHCKAILFDLDGTLIDSIAAVDRAWTRWSERHGLDPAEVVPQIHGRRAIESLRLLSPKSNIDLDVEEQWLEDAEASDTEGIVPISGSMEFVASIPEDRWTIVTSGSIPVATARMGAVGLTPVCPVYANDVKNGKPAPDPYLLAAKRLGFAPEACLVFEDTEAGIRAGHAAGMRVIAVKSAGDTVDLSAADAVIEDFRNLVAQVTADGLLVIFDSIM